MIEMTDTILFVRLLSTFKNRNAITRHNWRSQRQNKSRTC